MHVLNRRRFLELATGSAALAFRASALAQQLLSQSRIPTSATERGLLLYIDRRLGADLAAYRDSVTAALERHPLLQALASGRGLISTTDPTPLQLAYNHVILIALPDDPLLEQVWQREAEIQSKQTSLYAFGFGSMQGSIGYLEADRNPFLHSPLVPRAPYECQWISITGTDSVGVALAVHAFLKHALVNGIVGAPGWRRVTPTLLDRDPLPSNFTVPASLPESLGALRRIAVTQVAEDEYREVLGDAGVMPLSIWQGKFHEPGQWDAGGQVASFHHYVTGLHRRAYGNAVWAASFASPAEAAAAAPRMAAAGHLRNDAEGVWRGELPPYAWGLPEMGDAPATGTLELQVVGNTVLLTALSRALS